VLSFLFDAFIVVVIFRRVFASKQPNSETIFLALCIYLLAGFAFASIYGMVALLQPRAFYLDPLANVHKHGRFGRRGLRHWPHGRRGSSGG
jgi:hypothetical protein